jgi:hypothetical protein
MVAPAEYDVIVAVAHPQGTSRRCLVGPPGLEPRRAEEACCDNGTLTRHYGYNLAHATRD